MRTLKCPKCGETFKVDENDYNEIVKQVRDDEFKTAMQEREQFIRTQMMLEADRARAEMEKNNQEIVSQLKADVSRLQADLKNKDASNELAIKNAIAEKELDISNLEAKIKFAKQEADLEANKIREEYEFKLKQKETEVEYYKDLKTKLSTKLVGETLEQHCRIEYDKYGRHAFPKAYFEKDNDAKTGSKGDFIFKEMIEGTNEELISIMFEMKNENDTTATKHKNEDFFKELDKDRKEKGCEYAVLVSMLEPEDDYYNAGIVDVSYRYPKMFVVRPQNFMAVIGLLRNAALNAVQYKTELAIARNQSVDYSNFENELEAFKKGFNFNYNAAKNHFDSVIKDIDASIKKLTDAREALLKTGDQLRLANDKAQDVTVKRLTRNSPSVKEAIEKANKQ